MRIALGADHAGFALKQSLKSALIAQGHEVLDYGADTAESVDYPDFAALVSRDVSAGRADRGVLCCSTGAGMAIAANKQNGIRAAVGETTEQVSLTREHNDLNVLTLGAKFVDAAAAEQLVNTFLTVEFLGGRHARRVAKIAQLEKHDRTTEHGTPAAAGGSGDLRGDSTGSS